MNKSREQELIDIMFQVAQHSATYWACESESEYFQDKREEHMEWVAERLRLCGFDTVPMGMSWGILK